MTTELFENDDDARKWLLIAAAAQLPILFENGLTVAGEQIADVHAASCLVEIAPLATSVCLS